MRTEAERAAAIAAEENVSTAVSYLRSVAFQKPKLAGYSHGTILAELAKYQRTNDETYASFVSRYLSPEEIEREWRAECKRGAAALVLQRKRRRGP